MDNLQTLDIRLRESTTFDSPLFRVFNSPASKGFGKGLPNVTKVTIIVDDFDINDFRARYVEQDTFRIERQFSKLLQLENIQSLHVNHMVPEWFLKRPLPIAIHLTSLKLHYGIIQDDELQYILQAMPNLSELDIHLCYDAETQEIDCDNLHAALCEVGKNAQGVDFGVAHYRLSPELGCHRLYPRSPTFQKVEALALSA